jgi:hypothetical protein
MNNKQSICVVYSLAKHLVLADSPASRIDVDYGIRALLDRFASCGKRWEQTMGVTARTGAGMTTDRATTARRVRRSARVHDNNPTVGQCGMRPR